MFGRKPKMYRQGDVLIREVEREIKGREVPRDKGRVVLAYGEVTGHAHAIAEPGVALFTLPGEPMKFDLVVKEKNAVLRHEEHSAIELPKGQYEVVRQREFDPTQAWRTVVD